MVQVFRLLKALSDYKSSLEKEVFSFFFTIVALEQWVRRKILQLIILSVRQKEISKVRPRTFLRLDPLSVLVLDKNR